MTDLRTSRLRLLLSTGLLNFAFFAVISAVLDGDALNGYRSSGHFLLGDHGRYVEAHPLVWYYSWCHAVITLATFPVMPYFGMRLAARRWEQDPADRGRGTP